MKLRFRDETIPYPLFSVKGRLRLSGLDEQGISEIINESSIAEIESEEDLLAHIIKALSSYHSSIKSNFETLSRYEDLRGKILDIPAIVVALEGASATGKSLIALELIHNLTATRFISTDSVRQILRGIYSEDQHPELFCHTYQAHKRRQAGQIDLNPVIRGYLAQCEVITPHIVALTERVVAEGAISVIEGVHILPGALQGLSSGVCELLINPDRETHRAMFASKHVIGKLRTVSEDGSVRDMEFEATRLIQEYMIDKAKKRKIPIIPLSGYDDAQQAISALVISKAMEILSSVEEGGTSS
jgi:2-phosphoglycerate kinase